MSQSPNFQHSQTPQDPPPRLTSDLPALSLSDIKPTTIIGTIKTVRDFFALCRSLKLPITAAIAELIFNSTLEQKHLELAQLQTLQSSDDLHIVEKCEMKKASKDSCSPSRSITIYPDTGATNLNGTGIGVQAQLSVSKNIWNQILVAINFDRDDMPGGNKNRFEERRDLLSSALTSQGVSLPENLSVAIVDPQKTSETLQFKLGSFSVNAHRLPKEEADSPEELSEVEFSNTDEESDSNVGIVEEPDQDYEPEIALNIPGDQFQLRNAPLVLMEKILRLAGATSPEKYLSLIHEPYVLGEWISIKKLGASFPHSKYSLLEQEHDFILYKGKWQLDRSIGIMCPIKNGSIQLNWCNNAVPDEKGFDLLITWPDDVDKLHLFPWAKLMRLAEPWMLPKPPTIQNLETIVPALFSGGKNFQPLPLKRAGDLAVLDPDSLFIDNISAEELILLFTELGFERVANIGQNICEAITTGRFVDSDWFQSCSYLTDSITLTQRIRETYQSGIFSENLDISIRHDDHHDEIPDDSLVGIELNVSRAHSSHPTLEDKNAFDINIIWPQGCGDELNNEGINRRWLAIAFILEKASEIGCVGNNNWRGNASRPNCTFFWNNKCSLIARKIIPLEESLKKSGAKWKNEFFLSTLDVSGVHSILRRAGIDLNLSEIRKILEACTNPNHSLTLRDLPGIIALPGPAYLETRQEITLTGNLPITDIFKSIVLPIHRWTSVKLELMNISDEVFPEGAIRINWSGKSKQVGKRAVTSLKKQLKERIKNKPDSWDFR